MPILLKKYCRHTIRSWRLGGEHTIRIAIEQAELRDLGYIGYPYTWCNGRGGSDNVKERLDKFYATSEWISEYTNTRVHHKICSYSDHLPIVLDTQGVKKMVNKRIRLFRFEAMWIRDENCGDVIAGNWDSNLRDQRASGIVKAIQETSRALKEWNMNCFGDVGRQLNKCKRELESIWAGNSNGELINEEKVLKNRIDELLEREEIMWSQRARATWLKEGDKNTKYFHSRAKQRMRKNQIVKLEKEDGTFLKEEEWEDEIVSYFEDLFHTMNPVDSPQALEGLERTVTDGMNDHLLRKFSEFEI